MQIVTMEVTETLSDGLKREFQVQVPAADLEARLLQGSALPIDSLLHDEVRHSLRRGFWDALERSRR